jgi:hypothetical protein
MSNKGQKAAVMCSAGANLIYTAKHGSTETVSVSFSSVDNTPVTMSIYHVKAGNSGAVTYAAKDLLSSPLIIYDRPVILRGLVLASLDDIVVSSDLADKLVVNINSEGQ